MRRLAVIVIALVAGVAAGVTAGATAEAHQSSVSYHDIAVGNDGRVAWTLRLSSRDLYEALGLDRDRDATDDEIRAGRERLFAYVTARLRVTADGKTCPFAPPALAILQQNMRFAEIRLVATCPLPFQTLGLDDTLFFDLDPRHSGLCRVSFGDRTLNEEFSKGFEHFEWQIAAAPPEELGLHEYVWKGMEHIYT